MNLTEAEVRVQMIENLNDDFLFGQTPQKAKIKLTVSVRKPTILIDFYSWEVLSANISKAFKQLLQLTPLLFLFAM
jgi:hypothetical protein